MIKILSSGDEMEGTIAVDLDATLAYYDHWRGIEHIGRPIYEMLDRVNMWLAAGRKVVIFTARVSGPDGDKARPYIQAWLKENGLPDLEITCIKGMDIVEFWDDRAVQVLPNSGIAVR